VTSCSQATVPASIQKGILRIFGTAAGAALTIFVSRWLAGDGAALTVALFVVSAKGTLGMLGSRHGYVWLLVVIAADVVLMALLSDPLSTLAVGGNAAADRRKIIERAMHRTLGCLFVVCLVGGRAGLPRISYTGFCLTGLPHKRLPDTQTWEKKGHRVTRWR
jgi:hypothetical protein